MRTKSEDAYYVVSFDDKQKESYICVIRAFGAKRIPRIYKITPRRLIKLQTAAYWTRHDHLYDDCTITRYKRLLNKPTYII